MDIEALGDVGADGVEHAFGFQRLPSLHDAAERFIALQPQNFLRDDWAFVEIGRDEMGGDTDDLDAAFVGLAICICAGERGQERGMNVDDLVFPAPDEIGREDFHESREDNEIGLVLFEQFENFLLGFIANEKWHVVKRQFVSARERSQVGPVADDDDGLRAQSCGRFREQPLDDMRFLRDENGQSLRAHRCEVNLRFHLQNAGGQPDAVLDRGRVEVGGRPRGLQGHAEVAARDLFLHGLNIGAQLEKKLRDSGDDSGLVVSDDSDGG